MKFAICNEFCQNWDMARVFELASRIGYDGVEIAPFTISNALDNKGERDNLKKQAKDHGIEVVGFHWLFVGPEGLSITHPDKGIRQRTKEYFLKLIDCCADLGGRTMVIGSPKQRNIIEGETFESAWACAKNLFLESLPVAEKRGILLLIEPLAPYETNFINTAEEAVRMIKEINNPRFKLILDVKAMSTEKRPIPDIIAGAGKYLCHFHANDADGRGPGSGSTDFKSISMALKKIGYDGYISVEVFDFKPDPETIAGKSYTYLKGIFR